MILNSFLRGLHSDAKLDFKCILLTSDRRQRQKSYVRQVKFSCQPYVYYICKQYATARY